MQCEPPSRREARQHELPDSSGYRNHFATLCPPTSANKSPFENWRHTPRRISTLAPAPERPIAKGLAAGGSHSRAGGAEGRSEGSRRCRHGAARFRSATAHHRRHHGDPRPREARRGKNRRAQGQRRSAQGRRTNNSAPAPPDRQLRAYPDYPRSFQLFQACRLCVKCSCDRSPC
jgi:hypothetical protein